MASCTGEEHRVINESSPFTLDEIDKPGRAHPMPALLDFSGMSMVRRKKQTKDDDTRHSRHNSAVKNKRNANGGNATIKFLIDAHMARDTAL